MTAAETCALPGCSKPPFPSPDRAAPHLACGKLHHQLLMAGRFHPSRPHPHQQILDHNEVGLCALPSCSNPPYHGHSWCSLSHRLVWLSEFTSRLDPDQICKLPGCTRHVSVDENSLRRQFCGFRHCQKFVMLSALQQQRQQLSQQDSLPSCPPAFVEKCHKLASSSTTLQSKSGHEPSVESRVCALRDFAFRAIHPQNIEVDEDFFNKHPWDVCTAKGHTWVIVRCKYTSKGKRVMLTRDDYHWKQQGRAVHKNTDYILKYFTYKKLVRKQNDVLEHHAGCTYFMEEYTIDDVKDYALIKLRKNSGKQCKGQPASGGKQSFPKVADACAQTTTLPNDDEMVADSFFWNELDELLGMSYQTEDSRLALTDNLLWFSLEAGE